jgi:hypothetical protein
MPWLQYGEKQTLTIERVRAAAKAFGGSPEREAVGVKKRVLSAAGRAASVKAATKRWAKVRKQTRGAA